MLSLLDGYKYNTKLPPLCFFLSANNLQRRYQLGRGLSCGEFWFGFGGAIVLVLVLIPELLLLL